VLLQAKCLLTSGKIEDNPGELALRTWRTPMKDIMG
jgi:hypothetical protein